MPNIRPLIAIKKKEFQSVNLPRGIVIFHGVEEGHVVAITRPGRDGGDLRAGKLIIVRALGKAAATAQRKTTARLRL